MFRFAVLPAILAAALNYHWHCHPAWHSGWDYMFPTNSRQSPMHQGPYSPSYHGTLAGILLPPDFQQIPFVCLASCQQVFASFAKPYWHQTLWKLEILVSRIPGFEFTKGTNRGVSWAEHTEKYATDQLSRVPSARANVATYLRWMAAPLSIPQCSPYIKPSGHVTGWDLKKMWVAVAAQAQICPVANQQCCSAIEPSSDPAVLALFGLLGITGVPSGTPVGITCTPHPFITGIACPGVLACCVQNNWNGTVAIDCTKWP
ncbi:hypothetical protein BD779DRAFT_1468522 [Infundibulicybe gibba]|nr:hypothetical protein BD779DRAFT_1468522 [Infundibulicybe gibba]